LSKFSKLYLLLLNLLPFQQLLLSSSKLFSFAVRYRHSEQVVMDM